MDFATLTNIMFRDWKNAYLNKTSQHTPILLLGPPGIGKSATGLVLADMMYEYKCRTDTSSITSEVEVPKPSYLALDLSSMLPEDLAGIPTMINHNDKKYTQFAPQFWWQPFTQPDSYGVLILDDISAADKAVQIATRQLVLYRKVGEVKLSDHVYILITGNRRDDQSGATLLPAHFRNSTCIMTIEVNPEGWLEWYLGQPNVDPMVAGFIRYKKMHLSRLPKDQDTSGVFATPRTWHKLGMFLHTFGKDSSSTEINNLVKGLVGEGVGVEFLAYRDLNNKAVPPREVLFNPKHALPQPENMKEVDVLWGLSIGLAYETSMIYRNEKNTVPDYFVKYMRALVHCFATRHEYLSSSFVSLQSMLGKTEFVRMLGDRENREHMMKLFKEDKTALAMWEKFSKDIGLR